MSTMNNTQIVKQLVSTCRVVQMMDRAQVVDTLRREGAVLVDGGDGYEVLLTGATRWVFETDSDSPWGLVPAWGAGTRGYSEDIFAVLDGLDTVEAQLEREEALRAAYRVSQKAYLARDCREGLCSGCEEAGQILPGHFDCSFGC